MKTTTVRLLYLLLGFIAIGLGIIGAFLPIMPTVPFLIVALWAFSKSSKKFHDWLYYHKIYGPMLRDWDDYKIIPIWGKIWACVAMLSSVIIITFVNNIPHWLLLTTAVIMFFIGFYICSTPNKKPVENQIAPK